MMGGGFPSQPQQPPTITLPSATEAPEDMECATGVTVGAWAEVKQQFRQSVSGPSIGRDGLTKALEDAIATLKQANALARENAEECGFGKFNLQLLSFTAIEDPVNLVQLFTGLEDIASPVLTMLLDVPWETIAQSGWPFFGLLAQMSARRSEVPDNAGLNPEAVDGLDEAAAFKFFQDLVAAMSTQDMEAMGKAAGDFLGNETGGRGSLGPLTAIAAQLVTAKPDQKTPLSQALQLAFKQVIGSGPELDIALGTRWPLWILLSAGVDSLAA